jgi:hypothetical protein
MKLGVGAALTLVTYLMAVSGGGGIYIIFHGLIVWGIVDIVRATFVEP